MMPFIRDIFLITRHHPASAALSLNGKAPAHGPQITKAYTCKHTFAPVSFPAILKVIQSYSTKSPRIQSFPQASFPKPAAHGNAYHGQLVTFVFFLFFPPGNATLQPHLPTVVKPPLQLDGR